VDETIDMAHDKLSAALDCSDTLLIPTETIMHTPGNEAVRSIITQYIAHAKQAGAALVPFVVFAGQEWLGMSEVALEAAETILGPYLSQDMLALRDYTADIGKPHTIKISQDEEITLLNGKIVQDLGIREVHQRIAKSPSGEWKVLVIEYLERLTDGAANALLKIFEEPLPKRLIIATTAQKDSLLPTILSRALVFPFTHVSDTAIDTYIAQQPALAVYDRDFLHAFSQGTYGVLDRFATDAETTTLLQEQWRALRSRSLTLPYAYAAAMKINKLGYTKTFFLAMATHAAQVWSREIASLAQKSYALTDHAISSDNLLFDFLLSFYATKK
jgi:DNA polymerase III, delta subunit